MYLVWFQTLRALLMQLFLCRPHGILSYQFMLWTMLLSISTLWLCPRCTVIMSRQVNLNLLVFVNLRKRPLLFRFFYCLILCFNLIVFGLIGLVQNQLYLRAFSSLNLFLLWSIWRFLFHYSIFKLTLLFNKLVLRLCWLILCYAWLLLLLVLGRFGWFYTLWVCLLTFIVFVLNSWWRSSSWRLSDVLITFCLIFFGICSRLPWFIHVRT